MNNNDLAEFFQPVEIKPTPIEELLKQILAHMEMQTKSMQEIEWEIKRIGSSF